MLKTLVIPLQLVCQFMIPENINNGNATVAISAPLPEKNFANPILPEGYTEFPDIGKAYKYHKTPRTWNLARKECAKDGANMAIIDSEKKIGYVMGLKGEVTNFGIFVGFHRLFDDVEWVNVKTAAPAENIPWISGNRYDGDPERNCMALHENGYGVAAVKCNLPYYFVCEVDLLPAPLQTSLGELAPN